MPNHTGHVCGYHVPQITPSLSTGEPQLPAHHISICVAETDITHCAPLPHRVHLQTPKGGEGGGRVGARYQSHSTIWKITKDIIIIYHLIGPMN